MSLVPRAISFDAVWSGECEGPLQSLFCRASLDGTCGAPVQEATVSAALLYKYASRRPRGRSRRPALANAR